MTRLVVPNLLLPLEFVELIDFRTHEAVDLVVIFLHLGYEIGPLGDVWSLMTLS